MTDTVCAYLLGSEPSTRENLARQLGKKGTSSDVCLYNYDKDFTLEVVDPLRYPDKPLAFVSGIRFVLSFLFLLLKEVKKINTDS